MTMGLSLDRLLRADRQDYCTDTPPPSLPQSERLVGYFLGPSTHTPRIIWSHSGRDPATPIEPCVLYSHPWTPWSF